MLNLKHSLFLILIPLWVLSIMNMPLSFLGYVTIINIGLTLLLNINKRQNDDNIKNIGLLFLYLAILNTIIYLLAPYFKDILFIDSVLYFVIYITLMYKLISDDILFHCNLVLFFSLVTMIAIEILFLYLLIDYEYMIYLLISTFILLVLYGILNIFTKNKKRGKKGHEKLIIINDDFELPNEIDFKDLAPLWLNAEKENNKNEDIEQNIKKNINKLDKDNKEEESKPTINVADIDKQLQLVAKGEKNQDDNKSHEEDEKLVIKENKDNNNLGEIEQIQEENQEQEIEINKDVKKYKENDIEQKIDIEDKQDNKIVTEQEENKNINGQVIDNKEDKKEQLDDKFSNNYVQKIYDDYVKELVTSEDFIPLIKALLTVLDQNGDCSSISQKELENPEDTSQILVDSFDIYKQITLAEHTYNVVKEAYKIVNQQYKSTWKITWPLILCVTISHDFGKSPVLSNQVARYYGGHALISSELFLSIASDLISEKTAKDLSAIIAYHHGTIPDNFSLKNLLEILKEADMSARQKELKSRIDNVKSWKEIEIEELAQLLYQEITENFKNVSFNNPSCVLNIEKGIIFINPKLFIACIKKIMTEKNIFWPEFMSRDDTERARAIVEFIKAKLSPAGWVPSGKVTPSGLRFFKIYHIEIIGKKPKKQPFIPFIFSAFCKSAGYDPVDFHQKYQNSALKNVYVNLE